MNIEKFNPEKDPKYIGYIFRFLKKKSKLRETLGAYPRIVKFKDGFGWYIGWFIDDGLGDFIGSRICYGSEEAVAKRIEWFERKKMTGIAGLIWLTGAAVVGLVLGLVVIAAEEVRRRRNGR